MTLTLPHHLLWTKFFLFTCLFDFFFPKYDLPLTTTSSLQISSELIAQGHIHPRLQRPEPRQMLTPLRNT